MQYYLQLAQQNQQALQQATQQPQSASLGGGAIGGQQQTLQIVQGGGQIQTISVMPATQLVQATPHTAAASNPISITNSPNGTQQPATQLALQGLNIQQHQQQQQQQQQTQQQQLGGIQIVQQIVGPNGEIQQIPVFNQL